MGDLIKHPFGAATDTALAYAATQNIEIKNQMTILSFAILTGACTLNLTFDAQLEKGARLLLKVPATATEVLTLGNGIDAPAIAGVAGKTKTQEFVYDGTKFVPAGAVVQID